MKSLVESWYSNCWWSSLLWPLEKLFSILIKTRKWLYSHKIFKTYKLNVPVVVVGNITVGGTGKTPLVIYLAKILQEKGYRPGIVSRGYRGKTKAVVVVSPQSDPHLVGDEAVLISKRTRCPMVVSKNRVSGAKYLERYHKVDIILSDDGLQHYALHRDLEIVVIDGKRRFGNERLLPSGPLREPISRLETVDIRVCNGEVDSALEYSMCYKFGKIYSLSYPDKTLPIDYFKKITVHAIAGIGNPQRFFDQLESEDIKIIQHPFPDHYVYNHMDISFIDSKPVLLTEKDAVKCKKFSNTKHWVVTIDAKLDQEFDHKFFTKLGEINAK